jgi:4-amino-4-deoxy-L-arabinose transferase-like glycosyltransferase
MTAPLAAAGARARTVPVLVWLALLGAFRLALAPTFEIVPQEAYYYQYARHLQLSYFDHPPVLAWLLRAFTELLPRTDLAIRLTAFSCTAVTQFALLALARRFRREDGVLLFAGTTAVTLISLISLPDVPLLMFWTLALVQLHAAIFEGRRWSWVAAGVLMGLAFDSKYTGAFLQVGLALFLVATPRGRGLLRTPWPWLALVLAHVVMLPVYVWNLQNGFASFAFQTAGRASRFHGLQLEWFLKLVGSQLALLLPPLAVAMPIALVRGLRRRGTEEERFLLAFAAPLVVLMVGVSLFLQVKSNWLLPAYVTGVLLAAPLMTAAWRKTQVALSAVAHVAVAYALVAYPVALATDDTWFGWKDLASQVETRVAAHPGAFVFSKDDYKTTAELRFYSTAEVYARNVVGQRALAFDYFGDHLQALRGRDAVFLDSRPTEFDERPCEVPSAVVKSHFESVSAEPPILIRRSGEVVRKFCVWFAKGYTGA